MTAGDIGVQIVISAGGFNMTGATLSLLAAPGKTMPTSPITLTGLTIAPDGLTATYTTSGTDFTTGGSWQLQLRVVDGTALFTSQIGTIFVSPLL